MGDIEGISVVPVTPAVSVGICIEGETSCIIMVFTDTGLVTLRMGVERRGGSIYPLVLLRNGYLANFFYCFGTPKFVITTYWLQSSAYTSWKHVVKNWCFNV